MRKKTPMKRKKRKPFQPDTPEDLLRQDWTGDCYRAAYSWASALKRQGWTLVHGIVLNAQVGQLKHAWCERGEAVVDLAMPVGMREFTREEYYRVSARHASALPQVRHAVDRIQRHLDPLMSKIRVG